MEAQNSIRRMWRVASCQSDYVQLCCLIWVSTVKQDTRTRTCGSRNRDNWGIEDWGNKASKEWTWRYSMSVAWSISKVSQELIGSRKKATCCDYGVYFGSHSLHYVQTLLALVHIPLYYKSHKLEEMDNKATLPQMHLFGIRMRWEERPAHEHHLLKLLCILMQKKSLIKHRLMVY